MACLYNNLNSTDGIADPDLVKISEITGGQMMDINTPEVLIKTFQEVLVNIREVKEVAEIDIQIELQDKEDVQLRVTSPEPGEFTLMSKIDIHAEIAIDGKGAFGKDYPELFVEEFYAELEDSKGNSTGEITRLEMLDDGNVARGDMRKEDGIYSVFYTPLIERAFKIIINAKGKYEGKDFGIKKEIDGLRALPAAKNLVFS